MVEHALEIEPDLLRLLRFELLVQVVLVDLETPQLIRRILGIDSIPWATVAYTLGGGVLYIPISFQATKVMDRGKRPIELFFFK